MLFMSTVVSQIQELREGMFKETIIILLSKYKFLLAINKDHLLIVSQGEEGAITCHIIF